ncbi:MAG: hypothetical protein K2G91_00755, partial [Prevotella sp.]|nr:hypothetical protein [Prevotella sp.]
MQSYTLFMRFLFLFVSMAFLLVNDFLVLSHLIFFLSHTRRLQQISGFYRGLFFLFRTLSPMKPSSLTEVSKIRLKKNAVVIQGNAEHGKTKKTLKAPPSEPLTPLLYLSPLIGGLRKVGWAGQPPPAT